MHILTSHLTTVKLTKGQYIDDGHRKNYYEKGTEFYLTLLQIEKFRKKGIKFKAYF